MLEVIVGNRLRDVSRAVIGEIEVTGGIEPENFIIVPDRFSLLAEKMIFEELGISSTFNIQVLGISKLARLILQENGISQTVLNNDEATLIMLKVLQENSSNLRTFNGAPTFALASEILKIIAQLKANKVDFNSFSESVKDSEKLKDIAKIYQIYDSYIEGSIDQSDLLDILSQNVKNSNLIKKSNFFFAEFDSLTEQGYEILKELTLNAKRVVIGATCPNKQKNSHIFDADILLKISRLEKEHKIVVKKKYVSSDTSTNSQEHILKNLYAFSSGKVDNPNISLLQFDTQENELRTLAKSVLFQVRYNKKRFSDINVLAPNLLATTSQLERIFAEYKIPLFVDCGISSSELLPTKFLHSLFAFIESPSKDEFLSLIQNQYSQIEPFEVGEIENYLNKIGLFSLDLLEGKFSENLNKLIKNIKKILKNIKEIDKNQNYIEIINNIMQDFDFQSTTENLINILKDKKELKLEKVYQQVLSKTESVIKCFDKIAQEESTWSDFAKNFETILGEKEISSIPISIDSVFVGDSTKSFFEERELLFVIGAKQNALPVVLKDSGILSDGDIGTLNFNVDPTIRMINKRNKFKLYQNLTLAKDIIVSFSGDILGEPAQPALLINELQKLFTKNNKELTITSNAFDAIAKDNGINTELFDIQSERDFREEIIDLRSRGLISDEEFVRALNYSATKDDKLIFETKEQIQNAKDILAMKGRVSPTQLERFSECPFKHFFTHGLKIKDNEICKFDGRDIGNYFHKVAQSFVSIAQNVSVEEIIKDLIKNDERFSRLANNPGNKHMFAKLQKEAKLLVSQITKEQEHSTFKPKFLEKGFGFDLDDVKVSGFVDRVDIDGNDFRVIDYKSGEIKKSLAAVYEGVELQLFIYLIAMKKELGLNPIGAFYLPIGNDFSDKNRPPKLLLDGFVVGESGILKRLDNRYSPQKLISDTISIKLAKTTTIDNFVLSTKKNILSQKGLDAVIEYVENLIKLCVKQMFSGNIVATPLGKMLCKNCPMYSICSFEEDDIQRELCKEMNENDFINIVKGNE